MAYEIDAITDDCYEGTTCLINKFDIHDEKTLARLEADITFAKTAELENRLIKGEFNTAYYKGLHRYLFEDLYDWAGQFRKINFTKKGTQFVDHEKLETLSDSIFKRLKSLNYLNGLTFSSFVDEIVDLYCSLNLLNPFREGNGRTQRVFLSQLIRYNGYYVNYSATDKDLLMIATIQSAQGVTDSLKLIFQEIIQDCERI